ncbi:CsbD family protein [Streptomyces liliifuscus]|uniref:CsbD family protein n=1 Tax=Streptomyces liliifuscus TaxID=2797636 RepID=A0A7T7L3R0_9ACTN|nr:CsbD family protein [Streptomyces liliifuscus]QQM45905.1 CsbD family protein [Streptomyces liliifuscus]
MGKSKGKAKQMKGKMKETAGRAMGDMLMENEGRGEQMTGRAQELAAKASERVKKSER